VSASAGAGGSLDAGTSSPKTVDYGSTTQFTFNSATGFHVAGITGCGISYSNTTNAVASYTATTGAVTGDCTVSATFTLNQYSVSASADANGSLAAGTPSPKPVNYGSSTQFTFNADQHYHVASITGCGISYSNTTNAVAQYTATTGIISGDCAVTATFAINSYALTINKTGMGIVTSSPSAINCGTDCSEEGYAPHTQVTLTATPLNDGKFIGAFLGWSGGGCSGTGECIVTMDADKQISALFKKKDFPWTLVLPVLLHKERQ
jgi:hypothetical protein